VFLSWWQALLPKSEPLHKDRFALPHEVADLATDTLPTDSLLLGTNHYAHILHVKATPNRRELGNILIEAPTGGGKGQLAVSQLLSWGSSAVVFDIKGDLYKQTAGYRATLGPVFRFDTRGFGHTYDLFRGKQEEDELYAIAHQLMYEPHEGDGKSFTQRGTKMLTIVFLAGREANRQMGKPDAPLMPFVGHMADLGVNQAAALILCHLPGPVLSLPESGLQSGERLYREQVPRQFVGIRRGTNLPPLNTAYSSLLQRLGFHRERHYRWQKAGDRLSLHS
jgi:hypothetical protein